MDQEPTPHNVRLQDLTPFLPMDDMREQREEERSVAVVRHDVLSRIATTGDMVDRTGKLKP